MEGLFVESRVDQILEGVPTQYFEILKVDTVVLREDSRTATVVWTRGEKHHLNNYLKKLSQLGDVYLVEWDRQIQSFSGHKWVANIRPGSPQPLDVLLSSFEKRHFQSAEDDKRVCGDDATKYSDQLSDEAALSRILINDISCHARAVWNIDRVAHTEQGFMAIEIKWKFMIADGSLIGLNLRELGLFRQLGMECLLLVLLRSRNDQKLPALDLLRSSMHRLVLLAHLMDKQRLQELSTSNVSVAPNTDFKKSGRQSYVELEVLRFDRMPFDESRRRQIRFIGEKGYPAFPRALPFVSDHVIFDLSRGAAQRRDLYTFEINLEGETFEIFDWVLKRMIGHRKGDSDHGNSLSLHSLSLVCEVMAVSRSQLKLKWIEQRSEEKTINIGPALFQLRCHTLFGS